MSYFGFLILFLLLPIILLGGWVLFDGRRRPGAVSSRLQSWPITVAILLHALVALIYTTPWDNYLVATRVWWYDPDLVTGIIIGWVPLEEYTFFLLQPVLAGLWLFLLIRHLRFSFEPLKNSLRFWSAGLASLFWLGATMILASRWQPGNYLALELVWALPPIALQLAFGADILWRYRRLVFTALLSLTLYLSTADALAINWGTWTINSQKSLGILLGGTLPIEEFLFFLLTNALITFGVVLILAQESHRRLASAWAVAFVPRLKESRHE
jgi:lycopene cyclase domain-containing protein